MRKLLVIEIDWFGFSSGSNAKHERESLAKKHNKSMEILGRIFPSSTDEFGSNLSLLKIGISY